MLSAGGTRLSCVVRVCVCVVCVQGALGGSWRQRAAAGGAGAAAPAGGAAAAAGAAGPTRMLHGRPVSSAAPAAALPAGVSRNGPCPCNSGKKYKRCCGTGP
jgi:hypothetical protein